MKNLKYIILILITILCISSFSISLGFNIPWEEAIKKSSIEIDTSWDIVTNINTIWFSLLSTVKLILEWILVIFIVYIWIQMIWSMWDDEDTLSKAKKQLR